MSADQAPMTVDLAGEPAFELGTLRVRPSLREVMDRFPKVKIILDHFARADATDGPPYAKAQPVFDLARYPNVFLKLTHRPIESSMKPPASTETFFRRIVDAWLDFPVQVRAAPAALTGPASPQP